MQISTQTTRLMSLLLLGAVLCGCQTLSPQERRALDEKKCSDYGFRSRSEAFATCLMNLELDRRADYRSLRDRDDFDFWGPPLLTRHRVIVEGHI